MTTSSTYRKGQRGFIALTSVLIMSAVLMVLMYSTGQSSFYARFDALNSEYKRISMGLSEACSNAALLKIVQNYNYVPPVGGEDILVGSDLCRVLSVVYTNPVLDTFGNEIRKTATIRTNAKYPAQNGSWSSHEVVATIQNPSYVSTPPPTCSFVSNTNSIFSGQNVTLSWNTAGNATSFQVERNIGGTITYPYPSGPVIPGPITDSPSDSATYTGTITGPGGASQCVSPQSVTVQPSLGTCADTVLMLARDMNNGGDWLQEVDAAEAFLDLYALVTPHPNASVGSYKGLSGLPAEIPLTGQLTSNYAPLYSTLSQLALAGRSNGDDITAGIVAATNELNSVRHVPGRAKVLVLVAPSGGHTAEAVAALPQADAAKLSGIEIFAIDIGAGGTRDAWAALSSGSVPNPPHQPGSQNDAGTSNNVALINAENADDDNFFIPLSAADMTALFETIARKVCPATVPPPPPTPPPPAPPPPATAEPVTIGSWDEIIIF